MPDTKQTRDYSFIGPENKLAQDKGYAAAEWYASPIPRQRLKQLMKRKDGPGIRDTLIWFGLLIATGVVAYHTLGTWWAIPAFFIYGTIYATRADGFWHECIHGTPFKTTWLNEAVYQLVGFITMRSPTSARWSHTHHHSDTLIVGLDPEIRPKPTIWRALLMEIIKLPGGPLDIVKSFLHSFGVLYKIEKAYLPPSTYRRIKWEARIQLLVLLSIIVWCISINSIVPLLFVGLSAYFGYPLIVLISLPQHFGLSEDVFDHRLNSRTYYTNPIIRFLYMNMNYHVEHHMFPMVPYHALPALHEEIKQDCPPAVPSLWAAIKVVFSTIQKQKKDITYTIVPPLPDTAQPYRFKPNE